MFESIPIAKRLRYILILMGVAFLITLLYGQQVLGIYDRIDELEQKTSVIEDADLEIVNRQVRLKELSTNIRAQQAAGVELSGHADFLRYTESACSQLGLKMVALPLETVEDLDGYRVAHIDFSVEGMFHDILSLVYQMEYTDQVGSMTQVNLEHKSIRVRNRKREVLIASIRINRLLKRNNDV